MKAIKVTVLVFQLHNARHSRVINTRVDHMKKCFDILIFGIFSLECLQNVDIRGEKEWDIGLCSCLINLQ